MNKNDDVDIAGSRFDVDDHTKYDYLLPVWKLLEDVPEDIKIKSNDVWIQTGLDKEKGNRLMKELQIEFQNKVMKNFMDLIINKKHIVCSWTFDKIMLLCTRVDTGSDISLGDSPVMDLWKKEWMKNRGI